MSFSNGRYKRVWAGLAILLAGGAVGIWIPSCESVLTTVNPCGTVFGFCEPEDIHALFGDIPDWSLDPTCSIPYQCGDERAYDFTPGPRPQGEQP